MTRRKTVSEKTWGKAKLPYCVIYNPSGIYYVRKRIHGKLIVRSLKTKKLTEARAKLNDAIEEIEHEFCVSKEDSVLQVAKIKTVGDAVNIYREEIESNPDHKPATIKDARLNLKRLTDTCPHFEELPIKVVNKLHCKGWLKKFKTHGTGFRPKGTKPTEAKPPSWSSVKKTLDALKSVFDIAVEHKAVRINPAKGLKPGKELKPDLILPTPDEFLKLVELIRSGGPNKKNTRDPASAELIEGLAYTGMRIGEAAALTFADCNLKRGAVRINKQLQDGIIITPKSKESKRSIPMIPEFKSLLKRILAERGHVLQEDRVFESRSATKSLETACRHLEVVWDVGQVAIQFKV